jgi:glycyl-tRNA synthetase beta chain
VATFLLEIGTEELPADFARMALPQLEQQVRQALSAHELPLEAVWCGSTPRRLAVCVSGLPERQADQEEERKGPPAEQAFVNGEPAAAAIGFARRCGVAASDLEVRQTPKGPFVFARVRQQGQPTLALLSSLIPGWIDALQGRRFMRWGQGDSRFSRPVRWLVALLDEQVVPVQLTATDPSIGSGRLSRGHRLVQTEVSITAAHTYRQELAAAGVQVDRQQRAQWIRQQLEAAASAAGARPDLPEALFDELVDLVERPSLIEGSIDAHFLALPPEVLSTVMRSHQRYVPLEHIGVQPDELALSARATLLPSFLCIGNGLEAAAPTVRRGNERVLRARLADAAFFLAADRRVRSHDRLSQLERVTFAEGLGNLKQRAERICWFTDTLLEALALADDDDQAARRAAELCKHDLVSQMVGEFPELQGVMGAKYVLEEGESRSVALAVLEHYLPRGAGDRLPSSAAGAVVAMAERLELLLSIYAKGERPSGSSDPYGLRRAANGLLQVLHAQGWRLDLRALLQRATTHWQALLPGLEVDSAALALELQEFLRQRLVAQLEEEGFDADLVRAVAGAPAQGERLLRHPLDAWKRAQVLADLRANGGLKEVQAVVQRAARLAQHSGLSGEVLRADGVVEPARFTSSSEAQLLAVLQAIAPLACGEAGSINYSELAAGLGQGAGALAAFFDGEASVMVMCDDLAVRANRLNLLAVLTNQSELLADFSALEG